MKRKEIREAQKTILTELDRLVRELQSLNGCGGERVDSVLATIHHKKGKKRHVSAWVDAETNHVLLDMWAHVMGLWVKANHRRNWFKMFGHSM